MPFNRGSTPHETVTVRGAEGKGYKALCHKYKCMKQFETHDTIEEAEEDAKKHMNARNK